jgi:predicted metalloendopeptidase
MQTPQNNLYQWQNNEWLNNPKNEIPEEYTTWGSFTILRDKSVKDQIKICQELVEKLNNCENLNCDEKRIAILYSKIMQKFEDWEKNMGDYSEVKKELEIMNKHLDGDEWTESLANYASYCIENGIKFMFDFCAESDLENSENIILTMSQCNLNLPSRDYYHDNSNKYDSHKRYFTVHLENLQNIAKNNGIELGNEFCINTFKLDMQIAYFQMTKSQKRLYDEYYNKTNLTDMYKNINNHKFVESKKDNYYLNDFGLKLDEDEIKNLEIFMEKLYSNLNLKEHMVNNYKKNFNNDTNMHTLGLTDGDYFVRIFKLLLNKKNKQIIKDWLSYNIISYTSEFCKKEFHDEFFDFYKRKHNGQDKEKTFEKRASAMVDYHLGEMVGKIYVEKHFNKNSKKDIENMISNVLLVMKESLKTNDWLSDKTKNNALLKLSTFKTKIGYPDVWEDNSQLIYDENNSLFEIMNIIKKFGYKKEFLDKLNTKFDKTKWFMTPQTVNAYYHPLYNEIVFPAAILQPPFYCNSVYDVDIKLESKDYYDVLEINPLVPINHGGIIAVIAHEITHGYDDQGRKFDHNGNMVDWWNEEDIAKFKSKIENMKKQSDDYSFTDSKGTVYTMDSELTMGENLADLGGLTLSLKAMLLSKKYNNKEMLELFFKSWANIWKCNYKEETIINNLASDCHAIVDFRTNLVKNIDEFYTTFNVTSENNMYIEPENRVKLW